jgi:penicillin-binding protein 1A
MKRETFGAIEKDFIIRTRPLFDHLEDRFSTKKLFVITSILGFVFVLYSFLGIKDFQNIIHFSEYKEPSILYAQNYKGELIPIAEYYQFSRFVMRGDDLKENDHYKKPIQTILESEDGNFFYHIGIDPFGIARAAIVNLIAGRVREGASTITQQVVRVKFLTQERSFKRKIKEIIYSFLVEIFYSKKRILEVYINEVPLGHGTLGLKAASKFYFRKDPESLSWAESAVISGMTTKPMLYSPLVNTDTSYYKVKVILRKLIESGKISPDEAVKELKDLQENFYGTLNRSPNESAYSDRLNLFPYVTEYSRKLLLKYFAEKQIYEGGLKIYTTIDVQHQKEAEKAVNLGLKEVRLNQSPNVTFKNIDIFDDNYGEIADILSLVNDLNEYKYSFSKSRRQFERNFQEDLRDEVNLLNLMTGTDEFGRFIDNTYIHQKKEDNLLGIEASLVSFRPYTGSITSLVGGSGFVPGNQQIRSVQSYRQTGSAFKPILFASAMEFSRENQEAPHKVNASTQFMDSPLQYVTEDGDEWSPDNYSSEYSGFILLRKALELSRNSVAVRVIEHVGLKNL